MAPERQRKYCPYCKSSQIMRINGKNKQLSTPEQFRNIPHYKCTVKTCKQRFKIPLVKTVYRNGEKLSKINYDKMQQLYDEGKSDIAIADASGCSATTVYQWRKDNDLESNYKKGHRLDVQKAMYLYLQGNTDMQIADGTGVSPGHIGKWRRKNGLEVNKVRA